MPASQIVNANFLTLQLVYELLGLSAHLHGLFDTSDFLGIVVYCSLLQ